MIVDPGACNPSGGIPLFVEEMTKAVLEVESEGVARHTIAAVPFSAVAVPASLHASLMAWLDRLGPAKEVAQIGSAISREFSHALLAAVARKTDTELGSALDRLVQAGLLSRQGVPPPRLPRASPRSRRITAPKPGRSANKLKAR